jgi:hypothetical protein
MFTHETPGGTGGKRVARTHDTSIMNLSIDQSFSASTKKLKYVSVKDDASVPVVIKHLVSAFERVIYFSLCSFFFFFFLSFFKPISLPGSSQ